MLKRRVHFLYWKDDNSKLWTESSQDNYVVKFNITALDVLEEVRKMNIMLYKVFPRTVWTSPLADYCPTVS